MKKFLVRFDGDGPLWRKFQKWMKEEHQVERDSLCLPVGCYVGMLNDTAIFVDNEEGNMTSASVLTLEEWDKLVNSFVLPEKWCVKLTESNINILDEWRTPGEEILPEASGANGYLNNDKQWSLYVEDDYTEITFEQFKKYVLKENTSIVDKMKGYQTFQNINTHFQQSLACSLFPVDLLEKRKKDINKYVAGIDPCNGSYTLAVDIFTNPLTTDECSKKVYTIEDLSEGRVAVVNDGTKEELTTVLKAAFGGTRCLVCDTRYYELEHKNFWDNSKRACWIGGDKTALPTQSVKEFIKQLKTENMDKRFPFKLTEKDAKRIIEIACTNWRGKLLKKWASVLLMEGCVQISESFYKEMRKACTDEQHELFDDIFGCDDRQHQMGCWVTYIGGKIPNYTTKIQGFDTDGWIQSSINEPRNGHYNHAKYRKATPEEIAEAQCSYEDGELCFVKEAHFKNIWELRYAVGKVDSNGDPLFYLQQYSSGQRTKVWGCHKSAKGVELPKD